MKLLGDTEKESVSHIEVIALQLVVQLRKWVDANEIITYYGWV